MLWPICSLLRRKAFTRPRHWTPATLASCRVYLDTQLRLAFGKRPVLRLNSPEIAHWFHTYSRTRPGGANQALGILVTMLNFARSTKLIPQDAPNPCAPSARICGGRGDAC
ncbi:MAG TPA: hypothetical protein VGC40_09670 [Paenirhodobacter sp.]